MAKKAGILLPDGTFAKSTQPPTPEQEANFRKLVSVLQSVQEQTASADEALELLSACIVEYLNNAPEHVWADRLEKVIAEIRSEVYSTRGLKN